MTIEMLDKRTILVSLGADDMQTYSLRFEKNTDPSAEAGLRDLLVHVGEICGLDHRGKSYLIEALPSSGGCLLIISVHTVKRRRRYRVKRSQTSDLCVFFDTDAMLDFWRTTRGVYGYALYLYEERYVLLPSATTPSLIRCMSEYGEIYPVSATVLARVREQGKLLLQQQVQRRHIGGRAVAVRDAAAGDGGG